MHTYRHEYGKTLQGFDLTVKFENEEKNSGQFDGWVVIEGVKQQVRLLFNKTSIIEAEWNHGMLGDLSKYEVEPFAPDEEWFLQELVPGRMRLLQKDSVVELSWIYSIDEGEPSAKTYSLTRQTCITMRQKKEEILHRFARRKTYHFPTLCALVDNTNDCKELFEASILAESARDKERQTRSE